jgi:hypothetical protein
MLGKEEERGRTYWFIKLVLPTPLSPRMITWVVRCQSSVARSRVAEELQSAYLEQDLLARGHDEMRLKRALCGGCV